VDAQESRFLQRFTGVLSAGAGEIDFRLDDGLVAIIGQGEHL
jgi:hypothetical protein